MELDQNRIENWDIYKKSNPEQLDLISAYSIEGAIAAFSPIAQKDPIASTLTASIQGRVMLRRDQSKKLIFLTIQDKTDTMQAAMSLGIMDEAKLNILQKTLELWDIVKITGKVAFTFKGELTLWATDIEIVSKCFSRPPDKGRQIVDKEEKYRHKYLDWILSKEARDVVFTRHKIISTIRSHLNNNGFIEVETPILQNVYGGANAKPFTTKLNALNMDMYLRIATEISLKKMIVGGFERVYEIGKIFRNEGIDRTHNPEFTSIELYQAYTDIFGMMKLIKAIFWELSLEIFHTPIININGKEFHCGEEWEMIDYTDFFKEVLGFEYNDELQVDNALSKLGIEHSKLGKFQKIDKLFGEKCEPKLPLVCFVCNQPIEMSPLCKSMNKFPQFADRFELFINGIEFANAYSELTDPIEQLKRLEQQVDGDKEMIDSDFIEALQYGMPPTGGMGIGIDRLVMLFTGKDTIKDVIPFPLMRNKNN